MELVGIKRQNLFLLFICNVVLRIQIHEHTMYTLLAINTIINAPLPHHHVDEVQYQRKKQSTIVFLNYLHIAKAVDEIRTVLIWDHSPRTPWPCSTKFLKKVRTIYSSWLLSSTISSASAFRKWRWSPSICSKYSSSHFTICSACCSFVRAGFGTGSFGTGILYLLCILATSRNHGRYLLWLSLMW